MWIPSLIIAASLASSGRIGRCIMPIGAEARCENPDDRFPLQSVMKMIVSAAVLDQVDQNKIKLKDTIELTAKDASPGPQEFAKLIAKKKRLQATYEDLIRRSIIESDSTSIDVLLERIGGIPVVQEFLKKKALDGISIDRNERDLQAEFSGLKWRAEFADAGVFGRAVKAVPSRTRDEALAAYSKDPRDTATPRGMVHFLARLERGELLSPASTQKLIRIMEETETGTDRLKAGLPKGWTLAHKTGTSASWKGLTAATNDVGILRGPKGEVLAIAVFVADSKGSPAERAAAIAQVAAEATK